MLKLCSWRCCDRREPTKSKEPDVDSDKDIDVGLQLPPPTTTVYVLYEDIVTD